MKKTLLLLFLFLGMIQQSWAQNKLYMPSVKYTSIGTTTFQHTCYGGIQYYVNGVPWVEGVDYTIHYAANGISKILYSFGKLKPGDTFEVRDNCGSVPGVTTVLDDYVYVEVPAGNSHSSNNIGPNDETPPYGRLSTPLAVGKCEPITINAHGLHKYSILVGTDGSTTNTFTSGAFLINGNPLSLSNVIPDELGSQTPPNYSINSNGSISYDGQVAFGSNTQFSGQVPFSLEYQHNGVLPFNVQEFGIGPMYVRLYANNNIRIIERSFTGNVETDLFGDYTNVNIKITYNGSEFKLLINNTVAKILPRTVIYSSSDGGVDNTAVLPYGTGVTWQPLASGQQWVGVTVDGLLNTRQLFNVAEDMVINETVTNVGCNGSNTGSITINMVGGQAPFLYSKDGTTFQTSNVFSGLTAQSYTITVKDASLCSTNKAISVYENPALTMSVVTTNANCVGEANGTATITASGGIGTYTYGINNANYQSSNTYSNLVAGTFDFWVKDAAGCTKTVTGTIGTNTSIDGTVTLSSVTCYGESNGSIKITPSGTIYGLVSYSLDGINFQSSDTFTGLSEGAYQVSIKDNACTVLKPNQYISQATAIIPTVSGIDVSCNGLSDGQIGVSATGGSGSYYFSLDGTNYTPTLSTIHVFKDLAVGNYKVWIKDEQSCIKDQIITINQPTSLSASIQTKTDVDCFGTSTGTATVAVSGGNGNTYQFSIGNQNYGTNPIISGLAAGTYTITVKDNKSCQTTTTVEILQASELQITTSISQAISCYAGNDGQILVSASGGNGGYTYAINGGTFQSSSTFINLSTGNYQITVQDNKQCNRTTPVLILAQPTAIVPTIQSFQNVLCYGNADGKVIISATGGTGAYTYAKDNINFSTNAQFTDLAPNNYTFTVRDGNGCTQQIGQNISQPADLSVSLAVTQHVLCYGGNSGIITTTATGGTSPFQYSLTGNIYENEVVSGSHVMNQLSIGTYHVWVKDNHGCIKETNAVTLTEPSLLIPSIASQTPVSCFGGTNASVTLGVSGGVGNYQYAMKGANFGSSSTFNGLIANTYTFVIQDGNGCSKEISTTITQPSEPYKISLSSSTNLSCYTNQTGVIVVNSEGGIPPYETWISDTDHVVTNGSRTFTGLSAGAFIVHGQDINGCVFDLGGINLTQPTPIQIQLLQKKDVDCDYYSRGEALVLATGSNGGFNYTLQGYQTNNTPIGAINNTSGLFQELKAGDYTLTATDQVGCQQNFTVTIISKNTSIRFDVDKTYPSSCLANNGRIALTNITGGRPPYQFGISTQAAFIGNPSFDNLLNGTYFLTVADSLCAYRQEVDLRFPNGISAGYTVSPIDCSTPDANVVIAPISGANGNYELSLNGGAFSVNSTFNNLHPNIYAVTIRDNPLSCQTVLSMEIKEQNRADLQFMQRVNVLCHGNFTGLIEIKGTNNLSPFQYAINSQNFTNNGLFTNLGEGTYKLYARNSIGCLDSLRAVLTQPTALVNTVNKVDNLCFGDASGSISAVGSGGVGPYTYSINQNDYKEDGYFNALKSGGYMVLVKDAHACVSPIAIELYQPSDIEVSPQYIDQVRCWGESNGKVKVFATGGTPQYQYSMDNQTYFESALFQTLPVGSYTFYVKDQNQCIRKNELTLSQPDSLQLRLVKQTNPLCFESKDGTIQVETKGGNGGYEYLVNHSNPQSNSLLQYLGQGSYVVTVNDYRGCSREISNINLVHPTKLTHNFQFIEPLCHGDSTGKINIQVNEGSPSYQMLIDGKTYPTNVGEKGFIFDKIPSRVYEFTTIDAHACEDKFTVNLSQPSPLKNKVIITENRCFGDATGIIDLAGQGASPPYLYAVLSTDRAKDSSFTNNIHYGELLAKSYMVRTQDSHACRFDTLVTVKQPTQIQFSPFLADSVRCYNEVNGKISIKAEGGTPTYVYGINQQNYQSSNIFTNLKEGLYHLSVKDAHGCLVSQEKPFYVPQPKELSLSVAKKSNPLCLGEVNGSILLQATGGNGQYQYQIDQQKYTTQALFDKLSQGIYTFKTIDWKGCEDTVRAVSLKWPQGLKATTQIVPPKCVGDENGEIAIYFSGGVSPYQASIYTEKVLEKPLATAQSFAEEPVTIFRKRGAGNYQLKGWDANGCMITTLAKVPVPEKINPIQLGGDLRTTDSVVVCKGQMVTLDANNTGKEIHWYRGETELLYLKNKNVVENDTTGIYKVVVKNATGCSLSDMFSLKNSKNALKADFLLPVEVFVGDEVVAMDITKPIPTKVIWTLPAAVAKIEENIKRVRFVFIEDGIYKLKMDAYLNECHTQKTHEIRVFKPEDINQTNPDLGYNETKLIESVLVSPNPNYGKFKVTVKLHKIKPIELQLIRNATGQLVHSQKINQASLEHIVDLDLKIKPDLYILLVKTEQSVLETRVVIID